MKLVELPWDSMFWSIRAARLEPPITFDEAAKLNFKLDYDFVRTRIPTTDTKQIWILQEDMGFRIFDPLVYMELKLAEMRLKEPDPTTRCRWHEKEDVPQIRKIASTSFTFDHHHQDDHFEKAKVDEMHALWVDKCIADGYEVDVAQRDGQVVGFLASTDKDGSCYIKLIAVDEKFRGLGMAEDLLRFTLTRVAFGVKTATVETEVANVPAVRLYEKIGFRVVSSAYTLHRWGPSG